MEGFPQVTSEWASLIREGGQWSIWLVTTGVFVGVLWKFVLSKAMDKWVEAEREKTKQAVANEQASLANQSTIITAKSLTESLAKEIGRLEALQDKILERSVIDPGPRATRNNDGLRESDV